MKHKYSNTLNDMYGLNYSQQYFKNLHDFLEGVKSKTAATLYRKKLREHQDKVNYTNELQKIRGELSRHDTRLPAATRQMLKSRMHRLKELGAQVVDEIK